MATPATVQTAQATTTATPVINKVTEVKKFKSLSIIIRDSVKNASCIDKRRGIYQAVDSNGEFVEAGKNENGRDKMPFFSFIQGVELSMSSGIITPKRVIAIVRFKSLDDANLTVDNFELIAGSSKVHTELQRTPFYAGQEPVQYKENGEFVVSLIDNEPYYRQYTFGPINYTPKQLTDSQPFTLDADAPADEI